MKVLVACEFSGIVRDAFLARGHYAMSCDLLPTESVGPHYQGDVFDIIGDEWDLMIAHPPCTYLCNSGVRWLHSDLSRWDHMRVAGNFFHKLLNCNIQRVAIENPVMHKYGINIIGRKQDQIIQPWIFGHTEAKATGLWLRNLPILREEDNVKDKTMKLPKRERNRMHFLPPSADRWKRRSTTYTGIALAMANQWG